MTNMGRPRKQATSPAAGQDVIADAAALTIGTQAADALAGLESAVSAEQLTFSELVGRLRGRREVVDAVAKVVTVTELLALQQFKDTKAYRGMKASGAGGKLVTVTTFDEFCDVCLGRSREAVDLDLRNLKTLGADAVDSLQRLGIGAGTMRDLRAVPADERVALIEVAKTGDRDAFVDLAESVISKHAREKALLTKKVEEAQGIAAARQQLLDKASEREAALLAKATFQPRPELVARTEEEQRQLEALREATNGAEVNFMKLANVAEPIMGSPRKAMRDHAAEAIRYLAVRLAEIIDEHGIEVSLAEAMQVRPAWLSLLDDPDITVPATAANNG
jgi:hypothetical protein